MPSIIVSRRILHYVVQKRVAFVSGAWALKSLRVTQTVLEDVVLVVTLAANNRML
jgi:hypothetical protein